MENNSAMTDGMHIVVKALKANGVENIYGVVGIPVTDLARIAQNEGIRYIGFRHEQNAGNAAAISGYITKKPGICLTVSAPGFLNGLVALANATTNAFPMIQISGSSDRSIVDLQQGDYEELDQMNIAKPFVKASYRVNKPEDIGIGIARAIRAAVSGRPGGVYLDLPASVLEAALKETDADKSVFVVVDPAPDMLPSKKSVDKVLQVLSEAKKPLVILGKGAAYSQSENEIKKFIEMTGIPFLPMSMAKGVLPDDHVLSAATARSFVLENADVVILLGARLNWLLGHGKGPHWSSKTRFIQVDIEPMEIDSNRPIEAPLVGDMCSVIKELLSSLNPLSLNEYNDWIDAIEEHKKINAAKMALKIEQITEPMNYFNALGAINNELGKWRDIYLVNEGANTLDNARNIINMYHPRRRLDCGTWGVMGIGMGYSIGAAVTDNKQVVAIVGDSAFGFSGMEIETICRYKLPVTIIVFNNGGIYRGDEINGTSSDPAPTSLLMSSQYEKLMEAFGGYGVCAKSIDELVNALKNSLNNKHPTLINCIIDASAGVESGHLKNLNPKTNSVK
ncbi:MULTISPECIES: oxalyl-CoA decarboxylase [Hafnia]|uniref:Oxalyl-CoA decarboxylase n=2 Tax=Hafnia alvei TaxID=569 RepID=A0A377PJC9_HAFAL|nr:oxalyl-CoA decarboxylase [Hafnia alvei]MDN6653219.1 oxalyl-CoA decarboxylase [Lactobacillus sp.]KFC87302.1 oxalyl-CoA decarboxylase [Hafnia alvei ATCC 13337]MCV9375887.1 oxalyl-CoA decarboxylase [Hafnia alvei]MDX6843515.1 oxalyl-CoA decarboxylase [Hafnia alvei]RLR12399.1 oxalyl-CoA decarboxylase [Hafnia alvei ATCC 13337]